MHNGPFNELASFDIPELIFQAKVTKFGIKVGLNMVINISSGFFHSRQKKFGEFFSHFPTSHISPGALAKKSWQPGKKNVES